jgi:hypothetical protein
MAGRFNMNIRDALESLAQKRPIFHNEADFQHALAWELRELYNCKVRLEQRVEIASGRRAYLDIMLEKDGSKTAIELKYKMRAIEHIHDGEVFSLLNQGAQDIGRYDILKDLQRLERMVAHGVVKEGYLIYLTNDSSYYSDPAVEKWTADRDFRIHEGRTLTGTLSWSESTGAGTMRGREEAIILDGAYTMDWRSYSELNDSSAGTIKCLCIAVNHQIQEFVQQMNLQYNPPNQTNEHKQASVSELVITKAVDQIDSWIGTILNQITSIPTSQFDLRDLLDARLSSEGYATHINRDIGGSKIDIWATTDDEQYAIEVRYKTALLDTILDGKTIRLKNQAAQDISRYDFIKDIEKLEMVIRQRPGTKGYAVLITNDRNYWEKSKRAASVDEDFRIHQGRILNGVLKWRHASNGTTQNREEDIEIKGHYQLVWQTFKRLGTNKNEHFQMLIVEVNE